MHSSNGAIAAVAFFLAAKMFAPAAFYSMSHEQLWSVIEIRLLPMTASISYKFKGYGKHGTLNPFCHLPFPQSNL